MAPVDEQRGLSEEARRVTRAAALISVGNITSRTLGLVREMVKSYFFGAGGAVSAFNVAAQVPTMFYDQFVGGMLSSALVPVLSDYTQSKDRAELWRVINALISFLAIFLGAFVLGVEVATPWIARMLGRGLDPAYLGLAETMIHITAPAILFLNIAGVLSGALYALQRFPRPAFSPTVYNATLVLIVVLFGRGVLGVKSLAVGLLLASLVQVLFQWPGLRTGRWYFVCPFPVHPALKKIGQLYLPIGLGLLVDQLAVGLSFNLASRTGPGGIAWMKYAATLIQFPLGLVVTAVSVAILPMLSRHASDDNGDAFRATLAQGLRLVLILILPSAIGLLVLANPMVALLFQRGEFFPADTVATARVLRLSVLGLVFAALDQPLIFAFYARKDTWTPALVGVGTVLVYVGMALIPTWFHEPQLWQLILANSLKLTLHALLMLAMFVRKVGGLGPYGVLRTTGKSLLASLVMAPPLFLAMKGALTLPFSGALGYLVGVTLSSGVGMIVYLVVMRLLGVEELNLLRRALRRSV